MSNSSIKKKVGSNGNDSIVGGQNEDWQLRDGNDSFIGSAGADNVSGGNGNDTLNGNGGNDKLYGDAGNDSIAGGTGNDTLDGGKGNDQLDGGDGNDVLSGDSGNDVLAGGAGHDALSGGEGEDALSGGDGNDTLTGGQGDDTLDGGSGTNQLSGGQGDDVLVNTLRSSTLTDGEQGNDRVEIRIDGHVLNAEVSGNQGVDHLVLDFTAAAYADGGQADAQAYLAWLPTHIHPGNPAFQNTFYMSNIGATLRAFESVEFRVDGVVVDPNTGGNTPPDAQDDSATGVEDGSVTIDVLANDADAESAVLEVVAASDPAHGSVAIQPDGSIIYTGDANFFGTDTFTYTIKDGSGATDTATVTVQVAAVNDAPVANDNSFSLSEDDVLSINGSALTGNDLDVDGDTLTVESVGEAVNGTVELVDGVVTFIAEDGFAGTASFSYTVTDGDLTDTATVTLVYAAVADIPFVDADAVFGDANAPIALDLTAASNDPDGSETISVTLTAVPEGATFLREIVTEEGSEFVAAGTDLGGGTWLFAHEELAGLQISVLEEGTYTMTMVATATEASNGSSASASESFVVDAATTGVEVFEEVSATGEDADSGAAGTDGSSGTFSSAQTQGPQPLPATDGGDAGDGGAGSAAGPGDAVASYGPASIAGTGGYDFLGVAATATGGAGGSGGDGGIGGVGDSGYRGIFAGPILVQEIEFSNDAGDSGDGGSGGAGQTALAEIVQTTIDGFGRDDYVLLSASAGGGAGGSGGNGGEGQDAGFSGGGASGATLLTFIGGEGGDGGSGGAGASGGEGLASVEGATISAGSGANTIEILATGQGGSGGSGGTGGDGGSGASAGTAGQGASAGSGGASTSSVEYNVIFLGDGGGYLSLRPMAAGGAGGDGGNGGDAGYSEEVTTFIVSAPLYNETTAHEIAFDAAGDGGDGGNGGDATASVSHNIIHGGDGEDTVIFEVTAVGGAGGAAGVAGFPGFTEVVVDNQPVTFPVPGTITTIHSYTEGEAGEDGTDGIQGSAFAQFTGNSAFLNGGNDYIALAASVQGSSTTVSVGGNHLDGGSGIDTLELSLLNTAVNVDATSGVLLVGSGVNSFISFEKINGSTFNDTISGGLAVETLIGGAGDDRFVFDDGVAGGIDTILDFEIISNDVLDVADSGATGMDDLSIVQVGDHTQIELPDGTQFTLTFVIASELTSDEFAFL